MARFDNQDLTAVEFRECDLTRARMIGVVMQDAVIDGLVNNLVVNGVEVTSYVEAELDRRHPVRLLIRSTDPADLREAHRQLRATWAATVERLREMPQGSEHQRVGGEWSAVETLRHLVFVHDSWFRRCCLGSTRPFTAIGLASDVVPDQEGQGLDRAAVAGLDDVLAVRDQQAAELERWLATVTSDELSAAAPVPEGPGWPPYARGRSVLECLHVVLNEEWAHHGFCVRVSSRAKRDLAIDLHERGPRRETGVVASTSTPVILAPIMDIMSFTRITSGQRPRHRATAPSRCALPTVWRQDSSSPPATDHQPRLIYSVARRALCA
ncbi:MAG: DinB family protein [Nocardioidaceae bacterium]